MEILDLLKEKKISQVTGLLDSMNNVDIATLLEEINLECAIKLFRLLKTDDAAEVFSYLNILTLHYYSGLKLFFQSYWKILFWYM